VMMHAQNAALFLGQIPNPKTGQPEINLDLARMFIDQLEMIQEKTRGNVTNEEAIVLRNTLSNLQMAYVEASGTPGRSPGAPDAPAHAESPQSTPPQPAEGFAEQSPPVASSDSEPESRKKFTKSYGP